VKISGPAIVPFSRCVLFIIFLQTIQAATDSSVSAIGATSFDSKALIESRRTKTRHAWEREHLEGSRDLIFRNTFRDAEYALRTCAGNGTRFEFECYDVGHLYNLAHFLDRGLVQRPLFVQTVFGILGGIGTHPEDVMHMKRTADRLFGRDYLWSVLAAGRKQLPIATMAAGMGGNIRVGLEDNLWIGPGESASSNAAQVHRACQIIQGLGLEVATPADAREILALKGGDKVAF
jgi:uncharacterized protein (DUF849 family)